MSYLVMERIFEQPMLDADLQHMGERLAPCLQDHRVHWLRSYLSNDRRRMICTFEAPDAEAVRLAYRTAGYPFERVWQAMVLPTDAGLAPPQ